MTQICTKNPEICAHQIDMRSVCAYHPHVLDFSWNLRMSTPSSLDPARPYNELPLLPPKAEVETKTILKRCVLARSELAALKQAAALIPNQDVLINTIPLREAKDSSAIENIVTTHDRLFRFANSDAEHADAATKETLRYRTALLEGYRDIQTRPLTTRTAVKICQSIKNAELDIRNTPGTTLRNQITGAIIYTPPEGEQILRDKMSNWEQFLHNETDIDPVIKMAIAHYQFEAIHPFIDGNGRTGRIINILYLIEQELLELPILYLSRYINDHRSDYYRLLLDITTKASWEAWIAFILDAVAETSKETTDKIWAIKKLMDETVKYVGASLPKVYSRELVELLFTQPYCRIQNLVDLNLGNRTTASKHLRDLVSTGVLMEKKEGRDKLYVNTRFLEILTTENNIFKPYQPLPVDKT
jgi:Fic family protein